MRAASDTDKRLRPHPEVRFGSAQIEVDLQEVIARLRSEPHAGEGGHRQETLYRRDKVTIALFAFDRFTRLEEHEAKGVVTMQVLRGRFKITAEDRAHEMGARQMLVLAPGVKHTVAAEDEGEILLTVHLETDS